MLLENLFSYIVKKKKKKKNLSFFLFGMMSFVVNFFNELSTNSQFPSNLLGARRQFYIGCIILLALIISNNFYTRKRFSVLNIPSLYALVDKTG